MVESNTAQKQHSDGGEDYSDTLIVMYSEPQPLQVDCSTQDEDLATKANIWVQNNMIQLSQKFGVDFKGCEEEAYALLMKLDQRREKGNKIGGSIKAANTRNAIPKEVRNLFFDMNFKEGEPRPSGRNLALTHK